jgi:hypothetical protein
MSKESNPEENLVPFSRLPIRRFLLRIFEPERIGSLFLLVGFVALSFPAIGAFSAASTIGPASAQDPNPQATVSTEKKPDPGRTQESSQSLTFRNTDPQVEYVGSKACATCHQSEYQNYLQSTHSQATTGPEGRAELTKLPQDGVTVCQTNGERCYRVYPAKDGYYMSQFDRGADGSESHAEVEKIAFALGKPLIATGYVVQRGDYLFEAPLTFYKEPVEGQVQGWGLSPGYGNDAVGFTRPVVDSCLTCHLGRPRPTNASSNRYLSPPFEELAIGCESCHGPGALHVKERQAGLPSKAIDSSIVNPKHLSSELADDTCMYCHEAGQARIPLPGESFQDYRPGVSLLRTQAIFKSKLLLGWNVEEWSDEMATSACYRFSKGALRCSTCHDPHSTPSAEQAADYYRGKCLTCHQSSSCTLPLSKRQDTQPVDNCITCHMPQHISPKLVKLGGRGTSHRITKSDGEDLPSLDTPRTAPDPGTGLILVNSDSPDAQKRLSRDVLLSAYQGVLARDTSRTDIVERYRTLLESMTEEHSNPLVLSALAGAELAKRTPEGDRQAIEDLKKAVELDSKFPKDYLLLSDLQSRSGDFGGAIQSLSTAIERFPFNPTPYEKLAECYQRAGEKEKTSEIVDRGLKLFPSDKVLIQFAANSGKP